jgi:hypothetical protein
VSASRVTQPGFTQTTIVETAPRSKCSHLPLVGKSAAGIWLWWPAAIICNTGCARLGEHCEYMIQCEHLMRPHLMMMSTSMFSTAPLRADRRHNLFAIDPEVPCPAGLPICAGWNHRTSLLSITSLCRNSVRKGWSPPRCQRREKLQQMSIHRTMLVVHNMQTSRWHLIFAQWLPVWHACMSGELKLCRCSERSEPATHTSSCAPFPAPLNPVSRENALIVASQGHLKVHRPYS